jgi:eukaryotic-like serine/threonine-protein kinase
MDPTEFAKHSSTDHINKLCDQFKSDLNDGISPRIEDVLSGWKGDQRTELFRKLLTIEFGFRRLEQTAPTINEFIERFPQDTENIRSFFAASLVSENDGDRAGTSGKVVNSSPKEQFGDYEILRKVGHGGMGEVFKAFDKKLNRIVALKRIHSGEFASDEEVKRFHIEAEAAAKLDHPGIVPIFEVGEHNSEHFLSMGFVEGTDLNELLKNGPLPPHDAAALIQKVAIAMQYAHEHGIVHRDIKPANILLSRSNKTSRTYQNSEHSTPQPPPFPNGRSLTNAQLSTFLSQPRITDFGLAKNISADTGMTVTGQILGTVGYMPTEQASGRTDEIGPRSDVYSLGATLYATLTGRPPFQADNILETLRQGLETEPVSPRQINPAVDKDLETICLKCLEKDAVKRYVSAQYLADDLERYIAGKPIFARPLGRVAKTWRWCKRNRSLAAVGGFAMILLMTLAIGGPLTAIYQAQLKEESDRNANQANTNLKLSNKNLTLANENRDKFRDQKDIADRKVIELGLSLKRETTEKNRANTNLLQVDDVIKNLVTEISETDGPLSLYPATQLLRKKTLRMARDHYLKLIKANPEAELSLRLAEANFELSKILSQLSGDKQPAISALHSSINLYEKLIREKSTTIKSQLKLALSYETTGTLYRSTDNPTAAKQAFQQASKVREQLKRENEKMTRYLINLSSSQNNIGLLYNATGEKQKAMKAYRQAVKITEELVRDNPADPKFQCNLGAFHNHIGITYREIGKLSEALKVYQQSLKTREQLARNFPLVAEYQLDLAISHANIGRLYHQTGNPIAAFKVSHLSVKILKLLVDENPKNNENKTFLALTLNNLGVLYRASGKNGEALRTYQQVLVIRKQLAENNPNVTKYQNGLAATHNNIGNIHSDSVRSPEAFSAYRMAMTIRKQLADENPTVTEFQNDLAESHINLGVLYFKIEKNTEGMKAFQQALKILNRLVFDNASVADYQLRLSSIYNNIGLISNATGRPVEALAAYRKKLIILEGLVKENPSVTDYKLRLANTHNDLGDSYLEMEQPTMSILHSEKAISILVELDPLAPQNVAVKMKLRDAYFNLAQGQASLSRENEARANWQKALKLDDGVLKSAILERICHSLARSGQHAESTAMASQLLKTTKLVASKYNYSCLFAIGARWAEHDSELNKKNRYRLSHHYTARSFTLLEDVAKSGFFKTTGMQNLLRTDPDLNALRHLDEFRAFAKTVGVELPAWARKPLAVRRGQRKE